MKYVLAFLALVTLAPVAMACEGLSPGDELQAGGSRCTLAFLLADRTGLYFATAGHCIQEGEVASNPQAGDFGVGVLHYLNPENGRTDDGAPGEDFALIKVNEEKHADLNPKVCELDGPTGIYDATPGSGAVMHHGYGLVLGDLTPTRTREGVNLRNDNYAFYWTGAGVPGDSGSSVLHESGKALGVLTHLQFGASSDTNGGTHLHRGFQLAKEMKGLDLRLVLMGEDPVKVLQELRGASATPVAPAGNATKGNATAPPPQNGGSPPPTQPTAATPPGGEPARGDDLAPAANVDPDAGDARTVPGPGLALALVALALLARGRRRA